MNYLTQLPNDAESCGYKQTKPYHYEQVFTSKSLDFKGTEKEFLQAGFAYAYVQVDKYTRRQVSA